MKLVIDASVAVKWFVQEDEDDTNTALEILMAIRTGQYQVLQPVHWQAEVLSVLVRLRKDDIEECVQLLDLLEFPTRNSWDIYHEAARLAVAYNHHLFDTLYHALALKYVATLVTADRKYYAKAKEAGGIQLLSEFVC